MRKLQLKTKRLTLRNNVKPSADEYEIAMSKIKGEVDNDKAIKALLSVHEKNENLNLPTNQWLSFKEYLPPFTTESIVIYDTGMCNSKTLYVSWAYLQHRLLSLYYIKGKVKSIEEKITHFMLLSDPS